MDENTRRYYLDAMGVQCWQLLDPVLDPEPAGSKSLVEDQAAVHTGSVADTVAESTEAYGGKISRDAESIDTDNMGWPQLDSAIQQCSQCRLHETRKQVFTGRGNLSAQIMFVVLAASVEDEAAGVLCSGEAEVLFSRMLSAIDIAIDDVYITSLLKCSIPPNHTVSPKEIQSCNHFLKQQLQLVRPRLLVILGESAIRCLMQKNLSLDDFRAMNSECRSGEPRNSEPRNSEHRNSGSGPEFETVPLLVSYSPQELLLHPEDKRKAWSDLQLLQKTIAGGL